MSHTLDDDFEHFLCYQNWNGLSWATKRLVKIAYEHGSKRGADAAPIGDVPAKGQGK